VSIIRIARKTYTVPARLKGLSGGTPVRRPSGSLLQDKLMEEMERIHGVGEARIDYRPHYSFLVRKPGASPGIGLGRTFFPHRPSGWPMSPYAAFVGSSADVEYVRILYLAATTMESEVERALSLLLESGSPFDYIEVRDLAAPVVPLVPRLTCLACRTSRSMTFARGRNTMTIGITTGKNLGTLCSI